jgi:hypothetical protein
MLGGQARHDLRRSMAIMGRTAGARLQADEQRRGAATTFEHRFACESLKEFRRPRRIVGRAAGTVFGPPLLCRGEG